MSFGRLHRFGRNSSQGVHRFGRLHRYLTGEADTFGRLHRLCRNLDEVAFSS